VTARRILVYGVTGSGKSTAALRIGERLGLPVTLADELTWLPGWQSVDEDEQRRIFAGVVEGDGWVLDTAYGTWRDVVVPRAELVVGLDYPRWFSLQRLVRRTVARIRTKEPICNGNVETWRDGFFSKDAIFLWHFRSWRRKRKTMRALAAASDGPPTLLFRRPRDLEVWISRL